jgi:hypothetical protein
MRTPASTHPHPRPHTSLLGAHSVLRPGHLRPGPQGCCAGSEAMSGSRRASGENLKGPILGDFESIAELREHLYQRCQNRCKTRAHAKQLVLKP